MNNILANSLGSVIADEEEEDEESADDEVEEDQAKDEDESREGKLRKLIRSTVDYSITKELLELIEEFRKYVGDTVLELEGLMHVYLLEKFY